MEAGARNGCRRNKFSPRSMPSSPNAINEDSIRGGSANRICRSGPPVCQRSRHGAGQGIQKRNTGFLVSYRNIRRWARQLPAEPGACRHIAIPISLNNCPSPCPLPGGERGKSAGVCGVVSAEQAAGDVRRSVSCYPDSGSPPACAGVARNGSVQEPVGIIFPLCERFELEVVPEKFRDGDRQARFTCRAATPAP